MRKTIAAAVVAGALMSAVLLYAGPASAAAAASAAASAGADVRADFNNDGVADLAIGVPFEDSTVVDSGAVQVIYGSKANGLRATGNQLWTQDSPGIRDQAETSDRFGYALAAGDFNGDRYSDLAIGVPYEGIVAGEGWEEGAVQVIYGSATGLKAAGNQFWTQDSAGIGDVAESFDRFGSSLATGNLGHSAHDDLAIGVANEDIWFDGSQVADAGAVNVIYGSTTGLKAAGNQFWSQDTPNIAETPEPLDQFGYALAIGNFGGSSHDDLAVSVPTEFTGPKGVHVIYGTAMGLSAFGSQFWTQDSPGIVDESECCDGFGFSLAAGNLGWSAYDDLAIGSPFESVNADYQGAVNVIYGTSSGLSAAGNQLWSQDSPGIGGTGEESDYFGWSLAIGDFGKSAYADLAIGVPMEDAVGTNDGGVHVIYGSGAGLTAAGNQSWNQDSPGIAGAALTGDGLGWTLAAANFGRSAHADLVVGVPREDSAVHGSGALNVIYGAAGGLSSAGNQSWTQDSPGIAGTSEDWDQFGSALAPNGS